MLDGSESLWVMIQVFISVCMSCITITYTYLHRFIYQVLDGDFTPANKQLCSEASRPLIEAVEKLTAYGSSPEFASVPARISKEVGYHYTNVKLKT